MTNEPFEAARALLKEAECRLWTDDGGNLCLGVWECMDSEKVRQAAALVCPEAAVLHLERREVPLRMKVMSKKIASIEDARWRTWR